MEAPGRRQRMPPSDLRLYFQGLSDVHADILKELDAVVAEAADDEWQQLSENQRDRLLSAPFLLSEFSSREYNEDDFGGTVVSRSWCTPARFNNFIKMPFVGGTLPSILQ